MIYRKYSRRNTSSINDACEHCNAGTNKEQAIKYAILLLNKTLHMISLALRSLDEAEELQGCDRLSKPSSESPLRITYYAMKCEIARENYST